MAMANFFDKVNKAAAHVIKGFDHAAFASRLSSTVVGVYFDQSSSQSREGTAQLTLLVDMLSRFYPRLIIRGTGSTGAKLAKQLQRNARAINPDIELLIGDARPTVCVGMGTTRIRERCPSFYCGSDGWLVRWSPTGPVGCGHSGNPFGAGAAACFAAANVFRTVFADSLPNGQVDRAFTLSLLDGSRGVSALNPPLGTTNVSETHLVGLGAIGSAAVWTLARAPLRGVLHLIDHEAVDLSNLQRYVSTSQRSVGVLKVDQAARLLSDSGLTVRGHAARWGSYVQDREDYRFERVAVALDNVPDRLAVQGALPRRVLNAWTQPGDLGTSRHGFLGDEACLACLYLPTGKEPDFDELVASSLNMLTQRIEVRRLLYTNEPLSQEFLAQVATANAMPLESLLPFRGLPLRVFYQQGVCGSMVLKLASDKEVVRGAEVPMAFQSALAGILLAADIVADAGRLRPSAMPVATRINLLAPLAAYVVFPEKKRPGDRCICQDPDYIAAYSSKYADGEFL